MEVDVSEPKKMLKLTAQMECVSRSDQLAPFPWLRRGSRTSRISEGRNNACDCGAHRGRYRASVMQEPWEGGFTVVLPAPMEKGQKFTLKITLAGEFMFEVGDGRDYFPLAYHNLVSAPRLFAALGF